MHILYVSKKVNNCVEPKISNWEYTFILLFSDDDGTYKEFDLGLRMWVKIPLIQEKKKWVSNTKTSKSALVMSIKEIIISLDDNDIFFTKWISILWITIFCQL